MLTNLRNIIPGMQLTRKSNGEQCEFKEVMDICGKNYYCFKGFIVNKDIMSRFFRVSDDGLFVISNY